MGIGDSMRDRDRIIFARVAKEPPWGLGVWILVRGTNPASLQYIGGHGFTPKPIDCKAKTGKKGPCAGLVVNPFEVPDAFDDPREPQELWKEEGNPLEFSARKSRYSTETEGKLKGCVKLAGNYLHGDYDLKAVVVPGHESATVALVTELHGVPNVRHGPRFYEVQRLVNNAIGSEMLQHGAEDEYKGHSEDTIFVFYPSAQNQYPLGRRLDGLTAIQAWYENEFRGRRTANAKSPSGVPAGVTPGIRGIVQPDGSIRPANIRKH